MAADVYLIFSFKICTLKRIFSVWEYSMLLPIDDLHVAQGRQFLVNQITGTGVDS